MQRNLFNSFKLPRALTSLALLLCGMMSSTSLLHAQEVGLDDGKKLPLYKLRLGFDGNRSTGNFEQLRMSSRGVLFKRWGEKAVLSNSYRYIYMKNGDRKFADDFRDMSVVSFAPFATISPYVIALYHQSFTRFIDQRWMLGMGGAVHILRKKDHQLKIGLSGSYEWTTLEGRDPLFAPPLMVTGAGCVYQHDLLVRRDCHRNMWRAIPRIVGHHSLLDQKLLVDYEALWVVDPFNLSDERVFMGLTLSMPLTSWLRVYTHYDFSYESIILVHRQKLDSHFTFGLSVNYLKEESKGKDQTAL